MRFTATKPTVGDGEVGGGSDSGADAGPDADEDITFLYEVAEGVAHRSYGLNVARLARIPRKVLEVAAKRSRDLEDEIKMRRLRGAVSLMSDLLGGNANDQALEQLVSGVEQL